MNTLATAYATIRKKLQEEIRGAPWPSPEAGFLDHLDPKKYRTDFNLEGSCNYAFTLILRQPDPAFSAKVEQRLRAAKVEFRRGTSGGGNQLRQPYIRRLLGNQDLSEFPRVDHVHFYGYYVGNYPELEQGKILTLCALLNEIG